MSKGPGRLQRAALGVLAGHRKGLTIREVADALFAPYASQVDYHQTATALRSLRDRGLVVNGPTTGLRRYRLPS